MQKRPGFSFLIQFSNSQICNGRATLLRGYFRRPVAVFLCPSEIKSKGTERRTAHHLVSRLSALRPSAKDARRPALHRGIFRSRATLSRMSFLIPISQLLAGRS